jgi:hypothetical protein
MFRLVLAFILFALPGSVFAQSYKDSIRAQFLRYADLLVRKDFVKSVDYINRGLFKIVPKAQFIDIMEKTYNNPAFGFDIEEIDIISMSDSKTIDGQSYVKLKYSNYLIMQFRSDGERVPDTAATKEALQAEFGQGNVTYNASTDTYRIFVIENMVANSVNKRKWTFVVMQEKLKPILKRFIPK